jgi:peptidoglycan/LPS O-acetylase OafA/YrhL
VNLPIRHPAPPSLVGHRNRLPLLPALDGLRALAVGAVLLYHAGVLWIPGGFLGVEVFFVISGYLITAGLWREWVRQSSVEVPQFWRRRARRLLPALAVLLLAVALVGVSFFRQEIAAFKGELVAAAAYVSNWYLVAADLSYFAEMGRPSPLRHLWSLAIEEQFYLVWPAVLLVLAVVFRRARLVAGATLALALASAVAAWLIYTPGDDPSRVYYGTDTRAAGLLLGAALAIVWRPFERRVGRRRPRLLDAMGVAGIGVVAWHFVRASEFAAGTYQGGIQLVALATVAVLAAGAHPACRVTGAILGGRAAQAIGRRCYSIYLWHWPVFVFTRPGLDVPWSPAPTLVLRLALTALLAEVSYRFVEMPIRDGRFQEAAARVLRRARFGSARRRRQIIGSWSVVGSVAMALVLGVVISLARSSSSPPAFASEPVSLAQPAGSTTTVESPEASRISSTSTSVPPPPPPTTTAAAGVLPSSIVAVGDSVMLGAAPAVQAVLPGVQIDAAVSRQFGEAVAIIEQRRAAGALGSTLIVHMGTNGPVMGGDLEHLMQAVAGVPRVVLVTVEVDRRWEQQVNDAIRSAAGHPNVRIADWNQYVAGCPAGSLARDGVHLVGPGPACYAALLAQTVIAP